MGSSLFSEHLHASVIIPYGPCETLSTLNEPILSTTAFGCRGAQSPKVRELLSVTATEKNELSDFGWPTFLLERWDRRVVWGEYPWQKNTKQEL